jgi:hypothetical protein
MKRAQRDISKGVNVDHGFAVFRVDPHEDVKAARKSLDIQPEIANTIEVMVDDEGLTRYFLPDEFTVQFREGVNKKQAERIIKEQGCTIVVEQRTPGYYTVAVPEGRGLFEMIRVFSGLDAVLFSEPSEVGFDDALYCPEDSHFLKLWGLHNTGQVIRGTAGTPGCDINAVSAWDITMGDPHVVAVVIDSGIDLDHPDLRDNIVPRGEEDWDFTSRLNKVPDDVNGHGTHVAGTIVAVNNSIGVIGVAPHCQIMPLRVSVISGMYQNRADALNYVAAQACANPDVRYIINCSWEMRGDHTGVHTAIKNAVNANVVVVVAAGNLNRNMDVAPRYPAVYPEVVTVAATTQRDKKMPQSNYGSQVDVSAPGMNIFSTYINGRYTYRAGTSMAAPHAAGVAALIWSRNLMLTNAQVREIMENTCDNIDELNPSYAGKLGKGRINALRALENTPPPSTFELVREFPFPQENRGTSSALSFVRRMHIENRYRAVLLFLTQQPFSEKIYYVDPNTGAVLGSIDPVGNDTIGCMQWYRGYILVANVSIGAGSINKINPRTGVQAGSLQVPPGRGEGLTYDGTYLYYSTVTEIHVIHRRTGAVVRSFPPPGGECRVLAYGRGYLFSGNSSEGVITVFNKKTLEIHSEIHVPDDKASVDGLAFNQVTNELFIASSSNNTIYVGYVRF